MYGKADESASLNARDFNLGESQYILIQTVKMKFLINCNPCCELKKQSVPNSFRARDRLNFLIWLFKLSPRRSIAVNNVKCIFSYRNGNFKSNKIKLSQIKKIPMIQVTLFLEMIFS